MTAEGKLDIDQFRHECETAEREKREVALATSIFARRNMAIFVAQTIANVPQTSKLPEIEELGNKLYVIHKETVESLA